jgi:multiple sugar transport system substrate-binding protein
MNRHVRRLALVGATAAVLPLTFAVTGASSAAQSASKGSFKPVPASDNVTLTFLSYLPAAFATGSSTVNGLISGFEAAHPNITVKLESAYPTLPAVQQDEAAGTTPDVVQGTFDGWRYLVSGLGAINMTSTFGSTAVNAEWGGQFPYDSAVQQLAQQNSQVYGIPWTLSTPVLFYNASLFQKAGLNPADPPTTWSQLRVDAIKIKAATGADGLSNGCIGGGTGSSLSDWCLQAIIDSAGGKVLNSSATKLTFDNAGTQKALAEMQTLANQGVMPNLTSTQAYTEWSQGKLAMMLNTSAVQSTLLSDAQGLGFQVLDGKLPSFGTTPSEPTNSGSGLFILSKDPLVQRAAWEFIEYLTSPKSMTTITEDIGYPPLRPGLANSASYLGAWKHTNTLVKVNLAQLKDLVAYQGYPGPNYTQIVDTIANAATTITFENGSLKSTLTGAQATASQLMP